MFNVDLFVLKRWQHCLRNRIFWFEMGTKKVNVVGIIPRFLLATNNAARNRANLGVDFRFLLIIVTELEDADLAKHITCSAHLGTRIWPRIK